ncbi:WW domain binding protein 11-domain-containing protein [Rhizoctonia solani]|nr:WW domain binding protein 11-domain-containing protein [Rhizoctonia solani]
MAKGKSSNPVDSFRKAQRAKELKKNKENRAKARETTTLKKDTSGLETEIHELENIGEDKLNSTQKERLKELRAEVARIRKVKQDYVQAHPEQSHLVRGLEPRGRRPEGTTASSAGSQTAPAVRAVFGKNGLPLHPERSIYYDPVLNPYGMPPPGMPYAERALLPHEIEQDNEREVSQGDVLDEDLTMDSADSGSDDEEDDDIILPAGPPPSGTKQQTSDSDSDSEDSDDDIPMPAGPPPAKSAPLPKGPPPVGPPIPMATSYGAAFPPFPPNAPSYAHTYVPPPPPGFPTTFSTYPPPFAQSTPYPQQVVGREPKPRDRQLAEAARAVQDPLSNVPHVTYQAHQAQRHQLPAPPLAGVGPSASLQHGLPPKPGGTSQTTVSATISAAPELRDLKKEATAFMPASMRRATKKGPNTKAGLGLQINAAPNEDGDQSVPSAEPRKDLMSVLGSQLGVTDKPTSRSNTKAGQGKDDYEKFLDEVGSLL